MFDIFAQMGIESIEIEGDPITSLKKPHSLKSFNLDGKKFRLEEEILSEGRKSTVKFIGKKKNNYRDISIDTHEPNRSWTSFCIGINARLDKKRVSKLK